ncbi:MAG: ArsR family transcriptional regulator [Austwickia sp.]|nr:ArsR family transcriptional regulator [Austwickia sp.]MCO5308813.1 ArsR family transcriptional regulator [Austwickia sp.]
MYSPSVTDQRPGRAPERSRAHDAKTRDLVLRAVVESGPVTAASLAEEFELTPTAVRRHLDALEQAGQIRLAPVAEARTGARKGPGRPARAYVAGDLGTHADPTGFATDYDHVATDALRFLAEQAGPQAVTAFAQRRVAGLEERYGALVRAAGPDALDRARALAKALAEDGFAATTRPVGGTLSHSPVGATLPIAAVGVQLCQGHCPVQHVAAEFPQFCEAETEAFARLLGVHVQRLATLAGGGHACTTYVPHAPTQEGSPG